MHTGVPLDREMDRSEVENNYSTSEAGAVAESEPARPARNEQTQPQSYEELQNLFQDVHYRPRLMRMIQSRLGSRIAARLNAEDVIQSAFIRARKNWKDERPEPGKEWIWLYGKVWRQLQDEFRAAYADKRNLDGEIRFPDESVAECALKVFRDQKGPSTCAYLKELVPLVRRNLKPIEFEIIWMRIFDELSFREIAQNLKVTEEAVRKRYVRALEKLRATITNPFAS